MPSARVWAGDQPVASKIRLLSMALRLTPRGLDASNSKRWRPSVTVPIRDTTSDRATLAPAPTLKMSPSPAPSRKTALTAPAMSSTNR